jgi:predicted KAP-like P-loop ATPase
MGGFAFAIVHHRAVQENMNAIPSRKLDHEASRLAKRLRHQVGLGREVLVEAAMGESRARHQVGNSYPVVATLAKQRGGRLDDVGPVRLGLRFGDLHVQDLSSCAICEVEP